MNSSTKPSSTLIQSKKKSEKWSLGNEIIVSKGVFNFWNGDVYIGYYVAKSPTIIYRQGHGTYFCCDRTVLTGEWEDDKLVSGKISYPDRSTYCGYFEDSKYINYGIYTVPGVGDILAQFNYNIPIREIKLSDINGFCWKGMARKSSATLFPVNHFLESPAAQDFISFLTALPELKNRSNISLEGKHLLRKKSRSTIISFK